MSFAALLVIAFLILWKYAGVRNALRLDRYTCRRETQEQEEKPRPVSVISPFRGADPFSRHGHGVLPKEEDHDSGIVI